MTHTVVGERGEGITKLQRRNQDLSLTNGRDHVVAGRPSPFWKSRWVCLMPLSSVAGRWQIAVLFEWQSDPGLQAHPVGGRRTLDGSVEVVRIDVDRLPDLVVVDVAGHGKAPG